MDTNTAYVAGLIDGEGCIHLEHSRTTYRARISVGMTAPALFLLNELQQEWGGTLTQQRPETEKWAAAYTWHATGPKARPILEKVRPYLRLKGPQADLVLRVEDIREALPRRSNGAAIWTPEARATCAALKERLHAMNAKGPRAPVPSVEVA